MFKILPNIKEVTDMENYNLDTGKKYVKDIFASDSFYNIPEYQRPYVWEEDQVLTLLEDFSNAMEYDGKKEYFLGCMIWNSKRSGGQFEYICQDILDGQQRFITLFLLHAVMRDLSQNDKLKSKVEERLKQEHDEFDEIPERNRIVFEIRDDSEFLEKYVLVPGNTKKLDELKKVSDTNESNSIRNMARALIAMHSWWSDHENHKDEKDFHKYLESFFTYVSNKVVTLYLATPDNLDDAYNLFTVLNSRGVQLQVGDILRAQNLRSIVDDKKRKKYAEKWIDFGNRIDAPYRSFDDFLWALVHIKMKYRSDDNLNLTKAFNFMYERKYIEKGIPTFDFVETYVTHYKAITNQEIEPKDAGNLFSNLILILNSVFGSQYLAPLMHYRDCFGDYRILDFLIKLDNLLSVMWLIGKRTLQTRIFIILRKMDDLVLEYKGGGQNTADAFLSSDVLKYDYDDEKASTIINIEEFFDLLKDEDLGSYAGTRINKTRYLLLKLDLIHGALTTSLQFDRKISSVEHIMPRKIENSNWHIDPEFHSQYVHKLGNLVLIDRKKNSSMSNKKYLDKKEIYANCIETRANTNYIFMSYPEWTKENLLHNQSRIEHLFRYYYEGNSFEAILEYKANGFKEFTHNNTSASSHFTQGTLNL
ncbi:MAG: DUF262 domain-containing protein [Anaerolineae bacterium]|nr:DUF262 domain-containing protein [Anaerolineae bacterium]